MPPAAALRVPKSMARHETLTGEEVLPGVFQHAGSTSAAESSALSSDLLLFGPSPVTLRVQMVARMRSSSCAGAPWFDAPLPVWTRGLWGERRHQRLKPAAHPCDVDFRPRREIHAVGLALDRIAHARPRPVIVTAGYWSVM